MFKKDTLNTEIFQYIVFRDKIVTLNCFYYLATLIFWVQVTFVTVIAHAFVVSVLMTTCPKYNFTIGKIFFAAAKQSDP